MEKIIGIKKIYIKTGTTKRGKQYKLTKILGDDSNYYSTFSALKQLPELREHLYVKLSYEKGDRENTYSITDILAIYATNPSVSEEGGQESSKLSTSPPLSEAEIKAVVGSNLDYADSIVRERYNLGKDDKLTESQILLVSELAHEQHALFYLATEQKYKIANWRR